MKVIGRRGARKPSVAKGAAQGVRVDVGDGGLYFDSGVK